MAETYKELYGLYLILDENSIDENLMVMSKNPDVINVLASNIKDIVGVWDRKNINDTSTMENDIVDFIEFFVNDFGMVILEGKYIVDLALEKFEDNNMYLSNVDISHLTGNPDDNSVFVKHGKIKVNKKIKDSNAPETEEEKKARKKSELDSFFK